MSTVRTELASRVVTQQMQDAFARLSGDRNPMHMDKVAARRTQAAYPVVHGIHTLLWALESLAEKRLITARPTRIRVKFPRWVYLDTPCSLTIPGPPDPQVKSFQVLVEGLPVLTGDLTFNESSAPASDLNTGPDLPDRPRTLKPLSLPREILFESMQGVNGEAFIASAEEAQKAFPHGSNLLGPRSVAEIVSCSYIVGMEAPGLHSMFSTLDLQLAPGVSRPGLGYEVTYLDERFRKARIEVAGQAIRGTIQVFVRVPPVSQAGMEEVSQSVERTEFQAMRALIVGGSRGLGEVTAKVIAAGGGEVLLTYASGRTDAESLAQAIRQWGGKASTLPYDVRKPAPEQLAALDHCPTHVFYFATNSIFSQRYQVLSASALDDFMHFYVHAFYDLCTALRARTDAPGKLRVYYPSSVAIEDRPAGLTEYAMAKAAGEILCTDMNRAYDSLEIVTTRLPRLPTDQTATVLPERDLSPLKTIIPIVRSMVSA